MSIIVRAGGRGRTPWELPGSRFRRREVEIVKGGRRTLYELAAAIAATGREVELRGAIAEGAFEEICAAAGARPMLDPAPRLPREHDTIILPEGWPSPAYAPYVFSGARCIMMLLAPPGFAGWPYDGEPFSKPDPLTLDLDSVGRPEHFRGIAGIGCELWTHSRGIQRAAREAGVECAWIGSGRPEPFPEPGAKEFDLVVLEHNRWAPSALAVAQRSGASLLQLPRSGHAEILRGLGRARVLVWPSRVEGHSRIQVEARAMGTVPVALATNRFAEGLSADDGAVVVESVEGMPAAIDSLLDRPDELGRLATRARESARAQVDWDAYVERVDAALEAAPPPRPGAAARQRIVTELARGDQRLRARLERAEAAAEPERPAGRGGSWSPFRWARRRKRGGGTALPLEAPPGGPNGPTVFVVGAYKPRGGGYVAYHLGRIAAECLERPCVVVSLGGEDADNGRWEYPERFEAIDLGQLESRITGEDLLIANPSFSGNDFGLRLPGRKLMYVQGLGRPVLDGFFDDYVCASEFLRNLVRSVYEIDAPVIPPFVHLERIPAGAPWRDRPAGRILVAAKAGGEALLARFQQVMRREHPAAAFSLELAGAMSHDALVSRMAEHRYFLTLSPREGFGLMPLEAMAAGCTVVGFHGGGGTHFMRPGENCEVVGYPDMGGLCERMAAALLDESAAERLALAGRETAAGYGLPVFEDRWRDLLARLPSGAPGYP